MARFATEVERTVTARVPLPRAYDYLWDVQTSSRCMPGLASCTPVGKATFLFVYHERSVGPVSLMAQYTARYVGNGVDEIVFESTGARGDNTEVSGIIRLQPSGTEATRIIMRQLVAPDTPIPRLLQGLIRSFIQHEAADSLQTYLSNIRQALEEAPHP